VLKPISKDAVLDLLFLRPTGTFHVRELARLCGISAPTAAKAADALEGEGLARVERGPVVTAVRANLDAPAFVRSKRVFNLASAYASGLVDRLVEAYGRPRAIVMFGSYSRGEDVETSDVDIAVVTSKHASPDLSDLEARLERTISLHEVDLGAADEGFRRALANGIVLEGTL
jgi:predicted nucleotidyltransferase